MAQATATKTTTTAAADNRNLHWKQNNVGSTMLQKMGWKQGEAIGSKQRQQNNNGSEGGGGEVSGEGLKITKRPDGLGLGAANTKAYHHHPGSTSHESLSQVLQALQKEHPASVGSGGKKKRKKDSTALKKEGNDANSNSDKADDPDNINDNNKEEAKKKKKEKASQNKETILFAANKITHSRVRQAKFASKTAEDMACIFGKEYSSKEIADQTLSMVQTERKLRKEKRKEERRRKRKEKEEEQSRE